MWNKIKKWWKWIVLSLGIIGFAIYLIIRKIFKGTVITGPDAQAIHDNIESARQRHVEAVNDLKTEQDRLDRLIKLRESLKETK